MQLLVGRRLDFMVEALHVRFDVEEPFPLHSGLEPRKLTIQYENLSVHLLFLQRALDSVDVSEVVLNLRRWPEPERTK